MMLKPVCHLLEALVLVFSFILKYQPSSCVFETDAALTLALWIPPFEYQPKDKQQQTPTQVLRNAVSIFAVSIFEYQPKNKQQEQTPTRVYCEMLFS